MKTIARTATRKIAAIATTITAVKVYDQATGNFQPSTIDAAFTTLRTNQNARLVDMENGTYQVNVHSNWWYVLTTAALAEVAPATPAVKTKATARAIEIRRGLGSGTVAVTSPADKAAEVAPVDPVDAEAVEKLGRSKYAVQRAALLTIAEKTSKFRNGVVPAGSNRFHFPVGKVLADWGLVTRHGVPQTGFKLTEHGARVAAILAEAERAELAAEAAPQALASYGGTLALLDQDVDEADARAKAHPYRPAVGELVVGTLRYHATGKLIGGLQIGEFESVDTKHGIAHLRDGHMVVAVDIDSMRPAPQVPDASHLIGQKTTAELAVGDHEEMTGIIARVFRPSADGRYVIAQFEAGWVVRIPVALVEQSSGDRV